MFDSKFTSSAFDNEDPNLYEILDIKPEASPTEIRDSYLRIKNTYSKDSVALYTLVGPGEREDILKKIEQAYAILSNATARREYDQSFKINGHAGDAGGNSWFDSSIASGSNANSPTNVVSIDRVPPMETVENAERALISPVTDFGFPGTSAPSSTSSNGLPSSADPADFTKTTRPPEPPLGLEQHIEAPRPISTSLSESLIDPMPAPVVSDIEVEIQGESEWSGPFIRKVREARGISIEEVIQATRITRAYILAIEEENLTKLPAPVYIRGFVNQISRILRVANKDVAAAYMRRCQRLHPEKFR